MNHFENDYDGHLSNADRKDMLIHEQGEEDYTQELYVTQELKERMNYSCIEFNNDKNNNDNEDYLTLNYLCNILMQNNIDIQEINNLNKLNQIDFLKSFSKKAILSRKFNYSVNDSSRYILEKNDLQILIDFISNDENLIEENNVENQRHQQSIEDFTSMLAGENRNKSSNRGYRFLNFIELSSLLLIFVYFIYNIFERFQ